MTVFEAVKTISCNDAAQRLGLKGKRSSNGRGVWLCPFHDDHHPSMTCFDRDNRFYCFSCHASGDAANLYARVRGLSPVEAAKAALQEFGLEIPGGCDRPQDRGPMIRQSVVKQAVQAIRRAYQKGVVMFLQGQGEGMTVTMEKSPDPDSWVWNHALQRACKVQEEAARWDGLTDEEVQAEITELLAANQTPVWGEGLPTPGRALFREIMDELVSQEKIRELELAEVTAALDQLTRLNPPTPPDSRSA